MIHYMKQHTLAKEQKQDIDNIVSVWKQMSDMERTAFIDSINIDTNQEWLDVRSGKFTASTASEFLADPVKKEDKEAGKIGETAKKTVYRMLAERAGWREKQNPYMEYASIRRGLVFEPIARKLAEEKLGEKITECGFVDKDKLYGCSPDGLIMDGENINALIEIKCPEPMAFYEQLMGAAKREYQLQMQFAMYVCNCPRAYFVLYCPEISDKIYVLKYTRGIMWQDKIKKRVEQVSNFISEVSAQVESGDINVPTLE